MSEVQVVLKDADAVHAEIQQHIASIKRNTERIPWIALLWVIVMVLWWLKP